MDAILSAGLQPGRALSCGNLTEAVGNKKLIAAELDTTPQAIAIGKQPAAREFVERRSSSTQLLGHTLPPHDSLSDTAPEPNSKSWGEHWERTAATILKTIQEIAGGKHQKPQSCSSSNDDRS